MPRTAVRPKAILCMPKPFDEASISPDKPKINASPSSANRRTPALRPSRSRGTDRPHRATGSKEALSPEAFGSREQVERRVERKARQRRENIADAHAGLDHAEVREQRGRVDEELQSPEQANRYCVKVARRNNRELSSYRRRARERPSRRLRRPVPGEAGFIAAWESRGSRRFSRLASSRSPSARRPNRRSKLNRRKDKRYIDGARQRNDDVSPMPRTTVSGAATIVMKLAEV